MKLKQIENILKEKKTYLAEDYHVSKIGIFGSYNVPMN